MIFNLPDLGEGLLDAEIHEWFVKEGDEVKVDQPLVSMETAKAVVEVPSPQDGTIGKLFGQSGDVIKTGEPLVRFISSITEKKDSGTVVGNLEESDTVSEDNFIVGYSDDNSISSQRTKTTPQVRMLAKKMGIDLTSIKGTGDHGFITKEDVQNVIDANNPKKAKLEEGYEPLHGTRRAMIKSMMQSHQEIVPVSIFDEADINKWKSKTDITVKLIRAIQLAARKEPSLNAWFDTENEAVKSFDKVHLGLAMDSDAGLFVPVINNSNDLNDEELRNIINDYKIGVHERTLAPEKFKNATFTLSNFGKFAGKFASPIIVPPQVAILAVGRIYEGVVSIDGNIESHRLLPLSLTFDHRSVTGGEATRFLGEVIRSLQDS